MNKLVCGILTVILCLTAVGALAQESDLPEVRWTYPVSLTEIQSKYAMLVNADNMLEKDFEPDPLVKVTGVKRATSAAVYLEETAAKALTEMFNAAAAVTEYVYVNENGQEIEIKVVNNRVPEIRTKAAVNGEKTAVAGGEITVEDTVYYTHLIPGREYTVKGILMDRSTGAK